MLLRIVLALAVMVAPAVGQTIDSGSWPSQTETKAESKPVPWMVTILYELSVKDWIADLQTQGLSVSTVEGISESRSITNITSGLVIELSGQIVGRLANFRVQPKPDALTVITSDGRRFKPKSVEYDPATGYSVLEVPDLNIQPPPFAYSFVLPQAGKDLRLLYQVPDWTPDERSGAVSGLSQQHPAKRGVQEIQGALPIDKGKRPVVSVRVVEDAVRLAPKAKEFVVAEHLDEERWKIKQVDAPDGSIILTPQGEVVGLIEFFGRSKGVVKPIEELRKLADRLALNERARRGWLGVRLEQPSEEALPEAAAEVVRNAPVIVKEILPDSPAARTDLKPGDRIYRINDQVITSIQQLADLIAKTPLGTEILLDLYRNGELKHVNVRVEARPQSVIDALRRSAEERRESLSKFRFRLDESASARPLRDADRLARLGIKVEPLTPPMRELLRIEGTGGVLVTEVKTTGLAGQAGLRAGDAIVAVNGKPVSNQSHLVTLLNRAVRTGKATLSVSRQRKDVNITLNLSKPF